MVAGAPSGEVVMQALERRGRTLVRVHGRSMVPTLRNGVRVEVQPVEYDDLRAGDLVVFHNGCGILCHRLLRKSARLCYLKGDTNLSSDPPVIWAQVLGRVTRIIDDDLHIHGLDTPRERRRGALLARFSYLYALGYHALRAIRRCRWGASGIDYV